MDLTSFIDVNESNATEFFDANAITHETVFNTLLQGGTVIEHYPLWTERPDDNWLEVHYREHIAWSVELSLPAPPDLETIDMNDAGQRAAWLFSHYQHHVLVAQALNL